MTVRKSVLPANTSICALALSALLITSCSKRDVLPEPVADTLTEESTISATATPGLKAFTLTEIPFGNADLVTPGRGAEQWHNANEVNVPSEGTSTQRPDAYYRFVWSRLEGATQGAYNWSYFDGLVNTAIQKRQKFSFGIMTCFPGGGADAGMVATDGAYSAYPLYLHKLMQAEAVKDWKAGGTWVPNYNSANYLNRLLALNKALNSHIQTATYNGVKYKDVIQFIDIRGYGSYGEWHSGSLVNHTNEYPAGTFPTIASFKKIVDAHTQGFPTTPLVAMIAAFDAGLLGVVNNPAEIAYYILTTKNSWGPIGWRRDQWGATDSYLESYLVNNNRTFNGVVLKTLIMEKWKTSPITGEPPSWNPGDYYDLERQIRLYHATSFGNGNYGVVPNTTIKDRVRASSKACGYRLKITTGEAPPTITRTIAFAVKTNWQNTGIAPTYENWKAVYELQTTTNVVKWSGTSVKVLKRFLPSTTPSLTTDNFTVPSTVPAGTYKLVVRVKDPTGYRPNLRLAVSGRNADGSYTILSSVVVK